MNSSLKEVPDNDSSADLNNLKEFYLYLKSAASQNVSSKSSDLKIDLCSYVQSVLVASVQCKEKQVKNQRYDTATTVIDYILANDTVLSKDPKLPEFVGTKLNQAYFEQLNKAFTINPVNSLKTAKFLIKVLRNVLHQNLSIVNPLLQVMECGFKHSNNDVKLNTYECWTTLISNFALDREFFFKTKKFNLIITPLISKCKAYKDEAVSKSKALSWLCLLENINERMPTYIERALMPFLEFCFGFNDKKQEKFEHSYETLFHIGYEVFISIIFNGNLNKLEDELKKKFKYVNLNRYYRIKLTLEEKESWLTIIKYYFQIFPKKSFLDGNLMIETWKRMCILLKLNDLDEREAEMDSEYSSELDIYNQYDLSELANYFLLSSFELIANCQKENMVFITKLANNLCFVLSLKPIIGNQLNNEYGLAFKKCISLLLINEEEDENVYLNNLKNILTVLEMQPNLNNWVLIASKYHDHLKVLKSKTSTININQQQNETINMCLTYPFKMFEKLKILDSDLKLINNSISNVVKAFAGLVKSNRFKFIKNEEEPLNINDWCFKIFNDLSSPNNLAETSHLPSGDQILKNLQVYTQFVLYLLQNVIEFEAVNQQQSLLSEPTTFSDQVSNGMEIIERINNSSRKFESLYSCFTGLVEIIQNLVKKFFTLIFSNSSNETAKMTKDLADSDGANNEKSKQPLQIFCSLIELMSILFTRVKSYQISNRFLIDFASSIEMISELNAISKLAAQNCNSSTLNEASPGNPLKRNSRFSTSQSQQQSIKNLANTVVNFQSNRHSNDLYDKFSMQIASFIQNHLNKSYSNHQFDTCLLEKLEPIFFSFLKNCKLSLKQKTIQAWNTTFGKSTAETLNYTRRLETLFSDLKDEMSKTTPSSNTSIPWISLPYFCSIQSTNLTNSLIDEIDDYLMNEEKENKPKDSSAPSVTPNNNQIESKKKDLSSYMDSNLKMSLMKELINESSSSSVPVAMLLNQNNKSFTNTLKTPDRNSWKSTEAKSESEAPSNSKQNKANLASTSNSNFVFSPAGQNSFQIAPNNNNIVASCPTGVGLSSTANILVNNVMKTPDASNVLSRSSPRSLKHNSKRKLDLNSLIDQMPDQDFVQISDGNNTNKLKDKNSQLDSSNSRSLIKQPLTEHQKEMKKKKSFIPMEMQSVCSVLEPTMDSQMSCATTQDAFEYSMTQTMNHNNTTINETSKAIIEFSMNRKSFNNTQLEEVNTNDKMNESNNAMDISMGNNEMQTEETSIQTDLNSSKNINQTIKFQSKMNPQKLIELFEVKQDKVQESEAPKQDITNLQEILPLVKEEIQNEKVKVINISSENLTNQESDSASEISSQQSEKMPKSSQLELDSCSTPNRRRSARLKSKDLGTPKSEPSDDLKQTESKLIVSLESQTKINADDLTEAVESLGNQIVVSIQKMNKNEILNKLNEECKIEKSKKESKCKLKKHKNVINNKPNVMKINHKIGGGKIVKKTFKEQQNDIKKKLKYKRLIKKLKSNKKIPSKEIKNIEIIKDVDNIMPENNSSMETIELIEETIPLSELIKNNSEKIDSNLTSKLIENTVNTETGLNIDISKPNQSENLNKTCPLPAISTPTMVPKSTASFSEIAAATSESTAALIEKLNSTPTTSILKKKALQQQARAHSSASKCFNLSNSFLNATTTAVGNLSNNDSNLTPNKRRVSFCESVRIEEIEPNVNKSLFRTTPKVPKRAKLVLFNNNNNTNNSMVNRQVSSPSTSAVNSLLNSNPSNTGTQTVANSTSFESKSLNSSCLSPTVQSSKFPSSTGYSNSLNSIANQLKINSSRLSACEPSNLNTTASVNSPANTQMSPSSSLINFFSNNKQSFLSQRSSIIQQQMLQLNSQAKTDLPGSSTISPSKNQIAKCSPKKNALIAYLTLNPSGTEIKQETGPETKIVLLANNNLENIYLKLKNCKTSIEKLACNSLFQSWLENDSIKTFKSKNILTIADIFAVNSSQIESLPFKAPKQESLIKFLEKFDELNEKKRQRLAKKSAPLMGSVEEEMNKLEESNCLDTSIECENLKETNENKSESKEAEKNDEIAIPNDLKLESPENKIINLEENQTEKEILKETILIPNNTLISVNIKNDEFDMEIDMNASNDIVKTLNEETRPNEELEEALNSYRNYIMGTIETLNVSNLNSDQYRKLIEKIEEIEHTIASRSFQAKKQIRSLEKKLELTMNKH